MINQAGAFAEVPIFLFLCLICSALAPTAAQGGGTELWCVAKNNAEDAALQSSLDWACGPGGADCDPIQSGGACYDKANLPRMASFAFNDYFIRHGFTDDSCNFSNTAAVTSLNPSYHKCKFPSSLSRGNGNYTSSGTYNEDSSNSSYISSISYLSVSIMIHIFLAIALVLGH